MRTFESLFEVKTPIPLGRGGTAFIRDVAPNVGDISSTRPIILAPGLFTASERLKPVMSHLFNLGRRVITIDHSRFMGKSLPMPDYNFPRVERRKAAALLELIKLAEIESADIVGHCEGGLNATMAALEQPERVGNLILLNSAGLIEQDNFRRIGGIFLKQFLRDVHKTANPNQTKNAGSQSSARRPLLKTPLWSLPTIYSAAPTNITGVLEQVRVNGVRVGVIQGCNDGLFPPAAVERDFDYEKVDSYAYLADGKSGHSAIFKQPERVGGAILQMLDALDDNSPAQDK